MLEGKEADVPAQWPRLLGRTRPRPLWILFPPFSVHGEALLPPFGSRGQIVQEAALAPASCGRLLHGCGSRWAGRDATACFASLLLAIGRMGVGDGEQQRTIEAAIHCLCCTDGLEKGAILEVRETQHRQAGRPRPGHIPSRQSVAMLLLPRPSMSIRGISQMTCIMIP